MECLAKTIIRKWLKNQSFPISLKGGDRTAAKVDEVEYLIGVSLVGYTSLKDVFKVKPREGAYYKYIKLKNIAYGEN